MLVWVSVSSLILEDCTSSVFLLLINSSAHSFLTSVPLTDPYDYCIEIVLSPLLIFSSVNKVGILSPCYVSPLSDGLCWPLLASWSTLLSWLHWPTASLLFPHLCGSSFSISFADSSLLPGYWGPGFLKASTFPFLSRRLCLICPVSASLVFVDVSGSPSKRPAKTSLQRRNSPAHLSFPTRYF